MRNDPSTFLHMTSTQGEEAPAGLNWRITVRITDRMRANGATGKDLARELGVDPAAVSRKLAGRHPWRVDELPTVAGFLGVRVADLLDPEEVTPS
jgi:transcriptional regulator with XRE-family HTH domain